MSFFKRSAFFVGLLIVLFGIGSVDVSAQLSSSQTLAPAPVRIEVLERQDCAHCQAEREYLEQLQRERTDIIVQLYDIDTPEGKQLFDAVTAKADLVKATPTTIIGGSIFSGFNSATTDSQKIEQLIEQNRSSKIQGFQSYLAASQVTPVEKNFGSVCDDGSGICMTPVREPVLITIPFSGTTFDISMWTLPFLAAVIGFFDGFNPCAIWVLATFLLVLMQLGSKRQMWFVVGSFLAAEAVMYYLILNVWLKVWNFVGMDRLVTPIIGILAVGGGLFFLYEWYKSLGTEMACRVVNMEERSKIIRKIKSIATGKFTLITFGAIVLLATSVNIIEFACSIGYPQTFTKILEMNNLNFFQTQGLMLVYILFYMVDDLIIFGLALWGFNKIHLTESFSRWSALLGGLLMIFLGWLLIFYPAILRSFS
ncbi:MAG: glutaredoxin [Candidatus Moraniibacteriota bacterium]